MRCRRVCLCVCLPQRKRREEKNEYAIDDDDEDGEINNKHFVFTTRNGLFEREVRAMKGLAHCVVCCVCCA